MSRNVRYIRGICGTVCGDWVWGCEVEGVDGCCCWTDCGWSCEFFEISSDEAWWVVLVVASLLVLLSATSCDVDDVGSGANNCSSSSKSSTWVIEVRPVDGLSRLLEGVGIKERVVVVGGSSAVTWEGWSSLVSPWVTCAVGGSVCSIRRCSSSSSLSTTRDSLSGGN